MAFLQKEKCGSDSTCKVAAGYCYTSSIKVHLPSYKQTLLNICKNTLHGFPPGEMWLLNVVLTAHVKWLLVALLEGNHYTLL